MASGNISCIAEAYALARSLMALIRKFAYNILRLAMMNDPRNKTMPEMIDRFADDHSLIEEYVFSGIASFY